MDTSQKAEIPGKKLRPFDVKNFVLRRTAHIAVVGFVLFVFLSPAAFILRKPYYQTGGTILLSPEVQLLVPRDVRRIHGSFREFAMTQAERLKSEVSIRKSIESLPREKWPSFVTPEMPIELVAKIISRKVEVNIVGNSQLMYIGLVGDEAEGLAEVVNALIEGYVKQLEDEQEKDSKRRLVYLDEEKKTVSLQMEGLREKRAVLAKELKSSTFSEVSNPYYDVLIESQNSFLRASSDALLKKAMLEKAKRDKETLGQDDLSIFAQEMVETNESVYMIDNWTYQRLQDLRAKIDGLTPDNSDRIFVEEQMAAMTDYLSKFKKEMYDSRLDILNKKRDFELTTDEVRAESLFIAAKDYAEKMEAEMKAAHKEFSESSRSVVDGMEVNDEIDDLKKRLTFLDQRISEVNLDAKAPVFLSVEQPADIPGAPAGDNFGSLLGMIFGACFGLIGVSVLGFEFLDGRVRSPGDVAAALGAVPLEAVPLMTATEEVESFEEVIRRAPMHVCSTALRRSTVRLNLEREEKGAKIFLFTGASEQSGVSSLVQNFAAGFAHYVDRVLVVSFNDGGETLPEVSGDGTADDRHIEAMLNRLPTESTWIGRIDFSSDSQIVRRRSRIEKFLKAASEHCGVILIDSRPLIGSDLTQFVAAHSDTVVVVARRGYSQYSALRKAVEFLFRLDVPAMSAIFNASIEQPMDHLLKWKTKAVEIYVPAFRGKVEERAWKYIEKMPWKMPWKKGESGEPSAAREVSPVVSEENSDRAAAHRDEHPEDDDVILPS